MSFNKQQFIVSLCIVSCLLICIYLLKLSEVNNTIDMYLITGKLSKVNDSPINYQLIGNEWFLINGKHYPLSHSNLIIWPEDSVNGSRRDTNDRIVNQLMYIPVNYDPKTAIVKKIFLNTDDDDWKVRLGNQLFMSDHCPVNACTFVGNGNDADAIFFKDFYAKPSFERPHNQIWILYYIESAVHTIATPEMDNIINWTVSYRRDSDIATPYGKFYQFNNNKYQNDTVNINYAKGKTKKVAMFVSNCHASNGRLQYAKELGKYIDVDIYGTCGTLQCPREEFQRCNEMLKNDYKFYLSFENSNCYDYITEKFWYTPLECNMIPIVMGTDRTVYSQTAPPDSFIHVDDYKSPQHLAQYLHTLDTNDNKYNEYFKWKLSGQISHNIFMWCRVCTLLHYTPVMTKSYESIEKWWRHDVCRN